MFLKQRSIRTGSSKPQTLHIFTKTRNSIKAKKKCCLWHKSDIFYDSLPNTNECAFRSLTSKM